MTLVRATEYPRIVGTSGPGLWVDLPNAARLRLPTQFYSSIVGVLHEPTGELIGFNSLAGRVQLSGEVEFLGTAFFVSGAGHFVTAAHLLPAAPWTSRGIEPNRLGVIMILPQGVFVARVVEVSVNRVADLALGFIDTTGVPDDFCLPFMAWDLSPPVQVTSQVLCTAGFPGTLNRDKSLDLWPDVFFGQNQSAALETGPRNVKTPDGQTFRFDGPFLQVELNARPGLSGGPLCVFDEGQDGRLSNGRAIGVLSSSTDEEPFTTWFAHLSGVEDLRVPGSAGRVGDLGLPPRGH